MSQGRCLTGSIKIKVAWHKSGYYRFWIDDAAMGVNGSYDIPFCIRGGAREFRGIDTVFLHPGYAAMRMTLAEKNAGRRFFGDEGLLKDPRLAYWGRFRVKAY